MTEELGAPILRATSDSNYDDFRSAPVLTAYKPKPTDSSDTFEDSTMESISHGGLKQGLWFAKAQMLNGYLISESDNVINKAREYELTDQVQTLKRRLTLSTLRCEAAAEIAAQAPELRRELELAVTNQTRLTAENAKFAAELKAVRKMLDTLTTDHIVYRETQDRHDFEVDAEAYTMANGAELNKLLRIEPEQLTVSQYVIMKIHKLVNMFATELNLLRKQLARGAEAKRSGKDGSGPAVSEEHGNRRSIVVDHGLPLTKTHSTQTDHADWAPEAQFGANFLESKEHFLTPVNGPKTDSNQVIQPILQQLRLLQSDKEYLTKQVSNVTQKLAAVDKREQLRLNVLETRRAGDCEQADSSGNEDQRTGDCQSQLKGTFSQPVELTKEETLSTQIKSLQKQRDEALTQLTGMRLELKQTQHELESRTEMLQLLTSAVDPEVQRAGTSGELLNDLAAHKEFSKSAVDLEAAQAARKEALLLVDKLTAQLEASRTAYHELKLQSSKECTLLECKLREAENKLSAYEALENQLNKAIDSVGDTQPESPSVIHDLFPHIEHYFFLSKRDKKCEAATRHGTLVLPTLAARRMEHAMKLTKQLRELESKFTGSLKELREKKAELEVAKEQISTLSNLIALCGQPRDYLVATLARRECQMRQLRKKLSGTEHRLLMLNQIHQCVTEERDALATDLKRLLRNRRNVVHLTEQVAQLLRSSDVSNRLYNLHCFDEHTYIGRMPSEQVVGPRTCRKRILPPYDIDRS